MVTPDPLVPEQPVPTPPGPAERSATGHGRLTEPVGTLRLVVPAIAVFLASLALYARTLLPGLGFWDTAEFQTVGPVLGIAHPTGFPSYTLLLWLASVVLQPFGDEAFRANLLSALLVSGAAALTAVIVVLLTRRALLGLVTGMLLAVAPDAWRNALRADPHTLHLFLAALLLVLLLAWEARERTGAGRAGRWLLVVAVCFGLSLGNHALTLLLAPGVALFVLLVSPGILWRQWRLVLGCLLALVATTVIAYAYIPLRAAMSPALDYAHPTTWERLRYLVLGEQFRDTFRRMPSVAALLSDVWAQLVDNLGLAAPLAVAGVVLGALRHPRFIVLTGLWFGLTFAFALGYENADIERYYLVPLLVAAIWAALAVDLLWDGAAATWRRSRWGRPRPRPEAGPAAGADVGGQRRGRGRAIVLGSLAASLLLGLVLWPVPGRYGRVDSSRDRSATEWMHATLAALEPDAVIVSWWSYSAPLWYGRWVEGLRPDVTIIDDRTMLDEDLGDVKAVIERFLGQRPLYLMRLEGDLPPLLARYRLERVPGLPGATVYRVVGRTDR